MGNEESIYFPCILSLWCHCWLQNNVGSSWNLIGLEVIRSEVRVAQLGVGVGDGTLLYSSTGTSIGTKLSSNKSWTDTGLFFVLHQTGVQDWTLFIRYFICLWCQCWRQLARYSDVFCSKTVSRFLATSSLSADLVGLLPFWLCTELVFFSETLSRFSAISSLSGIKAGSKWPDTGLFLLLETVSRFSIWVSYSGLFSCLSMVWPDTGLICWLCAELFPFSKTFIRFSNDTSSLSETSSFKSSSSNHCWVK